MFLSASHTLQKQSKVVRSEAKKRKVGGTVSKLKIHRSLREANSIVARTSFLVQVIFAVLLYVHHRHSQEEQSRRFRHYAVGQAL